QEVDPSILHDRRGIERRVLLPRDDAVANGRAEPRSRIGRDHGGRWCWFRERANQPRLQRDDEKRHGFAVRSGRRRSHAVIGTPASMSTQANTGTTTKGVARGRGAPRTAMPQTTTETTAARTMTTSSAVRVVA